MTTTLYLVRNGATIWTEERRMMGRRDQGLSELGRRHVAALGDRFARIELTDVVSSPLLRAVDTAAAIASRRPAGLSGGQLGVTRDVRLIDVEIGSWEGRSFEEIESTAHYEQFRVQPLVRIVPDVEALSDVEGRVIAALEQLLTDSEVGARIAVVSHSIPIRLAIAHYLGMPVSEFYRLRVAPGSISVLQFDGTLPRLVSLNHTAHIDDIYDATDLA